MWKDFFYYSKGERRAVYVLSLLIVFFAVGSFVLPQLKEKSKTSTVMDQEDSFSENIRIKEEKDTNEEGYTRVPIYEVQLKEFDPNTADSMDFLRLGLKPFIASNIMKYRAKKGKFRTSEDFSRVYGMTDEQFVQLKPYIRISDEFVDKSGLLRKDIVKQKKDTLLKVFKYPEGTMIDAGTADTVELKKIPGIGSGIARSIVAYRNLLGGFYSLEQLNEVEYFTSDMIKWFKLDNVDIRKLNINKVGLDKLRQHPYLNFYQAKIIIEHRKKRGNIKSLSQLSLYEEFTEKDLNRLAYYFYFD